MKNKFKYIPALLILFLITAELKANFVQSDTVYVNEIMEPPVIDGLGEDNCWSDIEWQQINYVWITYGEAIDSSDFSGKFKVVWSSQENLLYFLIEVIDDTFIDGWPEIAGDYFAFDIIEVFLDPDKSGGLHVFDGTGSVGNDWGTNAENAFSYHINIDLPTNEEFTSTCVVNDIAGTNWGDRWNPDYSDHFPEIALRENNGKYFWEFSLKVYNDSYDHNNPETSLVTLKTNDVMGLSLAYCDNDGVDENPKTRDNFIGSVWVSESAYNDHWMNADGYGTIKLVSNPTNVINDNLIETYELFENYPNPFNPSTIISYAIPKSQYVTLTIYDVLGQKVLTLVDQHQSTGKYKYEWNGMDSKGNVVHSGIYFYRIETTNYTATRKMNLMK